MKNNQHKEINSNDNNHHKRPCLFAIVISGNTSLCLYVRTSVINCELFNLSYKPSVELISVRSHTICDQSDRRTE